ncbi:TIGR03758 family integrating conjugative element protein [Morganella morganii]|uniref:TIGR03758 family integrating conjugative element protein n=1 Tax=Morganella morganii TaxID=582 RepID=UPI0021CF755B|nr:TIGR03758 family integrating conjugative element protein [Morganella morganii]MCU6235206.1 TIGR03758 family integrating conjugative element protein [Morganella morganii]
MSGAQLAAFKLAALNTEPERLSVLFTGVLIAMLFLWTARGLLLVYRGYAAGTVAEPMLLRFVVRSVLLLVTSLFFCAG